MSRTTRKNYNPIYKADDESYYLEYYQCYNRTGLSPEGYKYYTKDWSGKYACSLVRFYKTRTRDGNKTHKNIDSILNKSVKRCNYSLRPRLTQEIRNMMAGNIGFDEHYENVNKIKMFERGLRFYDF